MNTDNSNIELTKEEKDSGYVVFATKVHPLAARQVRRICDRVGIKPYRLMQHVIACMVRMMGEPSVIGDNSQLRKLIGIFFSELNDFSKRYNIADPNTNKEITDSLFFLGDHQHPDGRQSVLVTPEQRGVNGLRFPPTENWNIAQQLEFFLMNADPYLYRKIRQAGAQLGMNNSYEILHRIAEEMTDHDTLSDEIAELFQDNDRSEYGTKPKDDGPYKRHHRKDINKPTNEDKSISHLDSQDFKPFGGEW